MNISMHGVEMVATFSEAVDKTDVINVELKDREGNHINLFFDSLDALESASDEFRFLVDTVRKKRSGDVVCGNCDGSGMGVTPESRCHVCKGNGEV